MPSKHRAFIHSPKTWKQTPDKALDGDLSSQPTSSPLLSPMYLSPWVLPTLLEFPLVLLVALCLLPSPAQAAWFQVGILGPWGCDPLFAKALPSVAAQLAVNRINRDPSLSYAATFDYAVLQVGC